MNKRHSFALYFVAATFLLAVITLISSNITAAAPARVNSPSADGDLDPGFGNGGNVTTGFNVPISSFGYASALQGDGKLLLGGPVGDGAESDANNFGLTRLNTDGSTDTTFGRGGSTETDFAYYEDRLRGIAVQTDGKIIGAGFARRACCTNNEDFALTRYNVDGTLDTSFSGDGKVQSNFNGVGQMLFDVKLQSDGKIVATGGVNAQFAVLRYNTDGTLDTSFSGDGLATASMGVSDQARHLAIQSDGKIVVAGVSRSSGGDIDFAVARFNANGTLDTSFSGDGKLTTDIRGGSDNVSGVAVQPSDGRILVAGSSLNVGNIEQDATLVRYNSDGMLDTTFDGDGILNADLGGFDAFNAVEIQSDNKIIAAGGSTNGFTGTVVLARYSVAGVPDVTFDVDGYVQTTFGTTNAVAAGVLLRPNGTIVATGSASSIELFPRTGYLAAQYNSGGALDTSFSGDGKLITFNVHSEAVLSKIAIQADGKMVAAGTAGNNIALARYTINGSLDASFGTGGVVTTTGSMTTSYVSALGLAIQSDGKIVTSGKGNDAAGSHFVISRYNTNGSLDISFGDAGFAKLYATNSNRSPVNVKQQPDGKLVVSGDNGFSSAVIVRLMPNGTLDSTFGSGGIVTDSFAGDAAFADLGIQSDGKIVITGRAGSPQGSGNLNFMLARYLPNGTTDASFGTNGRVLTDFGANYEEAYTMDIQPNGKILSGGYTIDSEAGYVWAMLRVNPNGTLDDTFDGDGKAVTSFPDGEANLMYSMKVQPDGRIIGGGTEYGRVARFNSDGSLDPSFGTNGYTQNQRVLNVASLAIQTDYKIMVGGDSYNAYTDRLFGLARYNNSPSTITPTVIPSATATATLSPATATPSVTVTRTPTNSATLAPPTTTPTGTLPTATSTSAVTYTSTPGVTATATSTTASTPSSTATSFVTTTPTRTATSAIATSTSTSTAVTTAVSTPTVCVIEFTDVPVGSTFYDFVRCMACRGIINGYTADCETGSPCFRPNNNVTRGQLSKIVSNAAGFNEPAGAQKYEDVVPGSTFYDFVWRLAEHGYVSGYPCGGDGEPCGVGNLPYFRPNGNATRGQISKIVANAAGFIDPPGSQLFEDVLPGSTFYDFVQRLVNHNVMSGYACGGVGEPCGGGNLPYFRPSNLATRGQTAKIVSNSFFPGCSTLVR